MIYSLGEALIDLCNDKKNTLSMAGGSAANFCAAVSALSGKVSLITKLGNDDNGKFLLNKLVQKGILCDNVFFDNQHNTGVIQISPIDSGSAFCKKRKDAADFYISENDISDNIFQHGDYLHFCSSALIDLPIKKALYKCLNIARSVGVKVLLDINYRIRLWKDTKECVNEIEHVLPYLHYIKIASDELDILYPDMTIEDIKMNIFKYANLESITITDKMYCRLITKNYEVCVNQKHSAAVDTTGAGDCFSGAFLYALSKQASNALTKAKLTNIIKFAATAALLSTEKMGAFDAMANLYEVNNRLRHTKPT